MRTIDLIDWVTENLLYIGVEVGTENCINSKD